MTGDRRVVSRRGGAGSTRGGSCGEAGAFVRSCEFIVNKGLHIPANSPRRVYLIPARDLHLGGGRGGDVGGGNGDDGGRGAAHLCPPVCLPGYRKARLLLYLPHRCATRVRGRRGYL